MTGPSSRMLALLSLLQARRDWPGQVLAERLGVTTRTVRRDVDRLRELGYRINASRGPDGGYRLEAGSEVPPLLFDDDQAVAVALALQYASVSGVDIGEAADRALATVRQLLPSRLRYRIDHIRFDRVDTSETVDPSVVETVSNALRERVILRFDYEQGGPPFRRVEPHGLVARRARWYLVGWDLEREEWRIFRLDRMTPQLPTGAAFEPRTLPMGSAEALLEARAKGAEDADRWPCTGEFEVDLPAHDVARWVTDGQVTPVSPKRCAVVAGSWSWTALVAFTLYFDAPVEILGPTEFVEAADRVAGRLNSALIGEHRSVF